MKKCFCILLLVCGLWPTLYAQNTSESLESLAIGNKRLAKKTTYEANLVFQFGGESKLTLLPKINLLRKHAFTSFTPYYGVAFGVHPLFIAGAYTFSAVGGIEKGFLSFETSLSHFRTTRVYIDEEEGYKGPYSQNLMNLKLGF